MVEQRIGNRYAKSLIDIGAETNTIEELNKDILTLKEALENRDLYLLVKSPIIKADKKIAIFKEIFGGSVSKVMMTFLDIVTRKGREVILPEMTNAFIEQYKKLKAVTGVKLTTATPMSGAALDQIKKALLESDVTDKDVDIETIVDPEIIGGFVIKLGDKLYDASISNKLDQLKKNFTDNKYIKSY